MKLDDEMINHPKIEAIGVVGLGLHVAALCYANQHLTDGFISTTRVELLINMDDVDRRWEDATVKDAPAVIWAQALVDAGVWEEAEGGYRIHDYLKYQPSRRQVLKDREQRRSTRAANGQQGGKRTASKRAANVQQTGEQTDSPVTRIPVPVDLSSPPSAGARAMDWFRYVCEREPRSKAERQVIEDLDTHGEACVAWGWQQAIGKHQPETYAKRIFDSCLQEGHGPRGKRETSVVRGNHAGGKREPAGADRGRDSDRYAF